MRISALNNTYYQNQACNKKYCSTKKSETKNVQFNGIKVIRDIYRNFPLPTLKFKDFTIEEYKQLNRFEKEALRLEYKSLISPPETNYFKDIETVHDITSDYMKESLNKEFGKGNYTIITIGRSLSSIGKVLGYKIGEDKVKNIPLSAAWRFSMPNEIERLSEKEISPFKDFISSIGLGDKDITQSGKKCIITDYCVSGDSLIGAHKLFTSDKIFGPNAPFITKNVFDFIPYQSRFDTNLTLLNDYLRNNFFKQFAFVKRNFELENTSQSVINPQKADTQTKLVWFKLLDNVIQDGKSSY